MIAGTSLNGVLLPCGLFWASQSLDQGPATRWADALPRVRAAVIKKEELPLTQGEYAVQLNCGKACMQEWKQRGQ